MNQQEIDHGLARAGAKAELLAAAAQLWAAAERYSWAVCGEAADSNLRRVGVEKLVQGSVKAAQHIMCRDFGEV